MGASNRLQDLDPALLRPGRFDRQVNVAPPDLLGREEILRVHTRSKPLAADVDIAMVARRTAGLTGADLANIANEAAIFAGRRDQQYVCRTTSTRRWSASSPGSRSAASSPRRRSGSSPTTRAATRSSPT